MDFLTQLQGCMPDTPKQPIPWTQLDALLTSVGFADLKAVQQNPAFHGEGDVYTHTQLVCQNLIHQSAFHTLAPLARTELFLAALLHDIGKLHTTRMEEGRWVAPQHAPTGSQVARAFLWQECGLCGTAERIDLRETVCALIRYHMLPGHLLDASSPERKVRQVAAVGELASGFSWQLLCMLAEADMRGRIAEDQPECLEKVALSRMLAEETGCLYGPYPFQDAYTRHAYLSGRRVQPEQSLYDDSWGEVIVLCGLPGTGKDTWCHKHHPDLPMVSLDALRDVLEVKPTDNQGRVIQAAQQQAREYLRRKQPFLWNATNLTRETRQKLITLCEQYGARVRIVYLETAWSTRLERNANRPSAVPEDAVERMLHKTVLPTPDEAQTVTWVCT
ncbi:MAG: AAA family ATPase [Aristaeellaceae bacterium]